MTRLGSENDEYSQDIFGIGHLLRNEVDLKSNVTEEEDKERDGSPDQVDDGTRGKAHRVPTAGHLTFLFEIFSAPILNPAHLTDAHHRVPTKASKAKLADRELKDGRADDQEGENPD